MVDESTILAITGDYDDDLEAARQVLLQIAENIQAEEDSGFDPSGLQSSDGGHTVDVAISVTAETTTTDSISPQSVNSGTDTSRSSGLGRHHSFGRASNRSDIEANLRELFPRLKTYDITSALKNAGGDPEKAFEELQNIQYFEETGERAKGIDGFFSPDDAVPRKTKGKKPRVRPDILSPSGSVP